MKYPAIALVTVLAAACVAAPGENLGSTEEHCESQNRLAANRLAANRLAANRLAANKLSGSTLSTASPEVLALASDPGGLELLTYMFSCAEPPGTKLVVGGTELLGEVGLAPNWLTRPLDPGERRWVSACLLARVNYYGVTVRLSMRATTGALAIVKEERTDFTLVEGAFWGDVFTGDAPQELNACRSRFKTSDPIVSTMPLRQCTVPTAEDPTRTWCGFAARGTCENVCTNQVTGDRYSACPGAGPEIITVSLEKP